MKLDLPASKLSGPFWKQKALREFTAAEWESLCDGCGICCLVKLEDGESGEVRTTAAACRHLEIETCRCRIYNERFERCDDCLKISPDNTTLYHWLPETCAYRRIAEGRDLPDWHPLITGNPQSVHTVGISVRDKAISARHIKIEDLEAYCIEFSSGDLK